MNKLLGIGAALVDCLAHVPEEFLASVSGAKGGMELIDYPRMQEIVRRLPAPPSQAPGGSAANTVMAFARLGGAAAMLAKVGSDDSGGFYLEQFREAGVDVGMFKSVAGTPTGACLSLITPDSQRTMRTFLGASATLTADEIIPADFESCRHLHIEGYLLFNQELMLRALRLARQAGCSISLDLGAPEVVAAASDILPDLLGQYVDMVFANQDEAAAFSGLPSDQPQLALRELGQRCSVAAVKLGAEGALIACNGETVRIPALRVRAIDTTGAGDLWAAGFLYGLARQMSLQQAGRLAARLGAEVVQNTGATLTEMTWQKVRRDFGLAK